MKLPWLYEPGMEFYRALRSGRKAEIKKTQKQLMTIVEMTRRSKIFHRLMRPDDEEAFFLVRHLDDFIDRIVHEVEREPELVSLEEEEEEEEPGKAAS